MNKKAQFWSCMRLCTYTRGYGRRLSIIACTQTSKPSFSSTYSIIAVQHHSLQVMSYYIIDSSTNIKMSAAPRYWLVCTLLLCLVSFSLQESHFNREEDPSNVKRQGRPVYFPPPFFPGEPRHRGRRNIDRERHSQAD